MIFSNGSRIGACPVAVEVRGVNHTRFNMPSETNTFAHSLERRLARGLRDACDSIPIGCDVSRVASFGDVTSALEWYLPAVLREIHPFWKHESLDGLFAELAVKTAPRQVEIAGLCILISDQTLTSYHVQMRIAPKMEEIEWLDCRLGEMRNDKLVRIPYASDRGKWSVVDRLLSIEWNFHVGFGDAIEFVR